MGQSIAAAMVAESLKTIYAYALSRLSHKEDAEDMAGDIVAAVLAVGPHSGRSRVLWVFVGRCGKHLQKTLRKKRRARIEPIDDVPGDDGRFDQKLADEVELNALRRELSLLSREYRECTVAYYDGGLSCAAESRRLGISPEMVKYNLFKSRKILKE